MRNERCQKNVCEQSRRIPPRKAAMGSNVSILTHRNHSQIAETIGKILEGSNLNVFIGPHQCGSFKRYNSTQHYVQRSAACNIILMSREMFQEERRYVEVFATALENEWDNIFVISIDDQWPYIDHDLIRNLKRLSFHSLNVESSLDNTTSLAESILRAIDVRKDKKSHFNHEHFLSLLTEMFGECEVVDRVDNPSMGVNLSLCRCQHPSSGQSEFYIGLFPNATLESCKDYLDRNQPRLMSESVVRYAVRSQPSSELSIRQSEQTSAMFRATALRFETMVSNRRFRTNGELVRTTFDDFIIPQSWSTMGQSQELAIASERMLSICSGEAENFDSRIIILSGSGGAGKTHFVRYLFNNLNNLERDAFFLTAESVRQSGPDLNIASLYDIYKASAKSKIILSREMFDLKFYVDDVTIIVDGLEEIVTLIGERFRMNDFFSDCLRRANQLANGKIIITSRDKAWPKEIESYADQYEINLFDGSQAEDYFREEFPDNNRCRKIASKIYKQMNINGANWPPLNCKLIAVEVRSSGDLNELENRVQKGEFASINNIQLLLEGVVRRDRKHGVVWPFPGTFEALGQFAAESVAGPVSVSATMDILSRPFGDSIPDNLEIAVKNFVLFDYDRRKDTIGFRFEFVETTLLAKYIVSAIRNIDTAALRSVSGRELFARRLVPGSDVSNKIIESSVAEIGDDFFEILDAMISDLSSERSGEARDYVTRQVVSNLLYIRLYLDATLRDVDDFTAVLEGVFGSSERRGALFGVSAIRFGQVGSKSIKFDLRGREMISGWFEDSPIDRIVIADDRTRFVGCTFRRALSDRPPRKSGLWDACYEMDCWKDDGFSSALSEFGDLNEFSEERCEESLIRFFRLFAHGDGHAFVRRRKRDSLQGTLNFSAGFGVDDVFDACREQGLMEEVEGKGEILWTLTKRGRMVARDLVLDALVSAELRDVIRELAR